MDDFVSFLTLSGLFLVGVFLGYFLCRTGLVGHSKLKEVEGLLREKEKELKDYKKQVAEEFTTTAEKFRELNKSYSALHKQLSSSANLLCDDVDITLLNSPADEEHEADFIEVQPSGTNQR